MWLLGIEPRFPAPQAGVLTTIRQPPTLSLFSNYIFSVRYASPGLQAWLGGPSSSLVCTYALAISVCIICVYLSRARKFHTSQVLDYYFIRTALLQQHVQETYKETRVKHE